MLKGKETFFIIGGIVIIIVSILGSIFLIPYTLNYWWLNLPVATNSYVSSFLFIVAIIVPIFVLASFFGFLWYQLFKDSLPASMTKERVRGKTKLFLYIVIFTLLLILVLRILGR